MREFAPGPPRILKFSRQKHVIHDAAREMLITLKKQLTHLKQFQNLKQKSSLHAHMVN